MTVHRVLCCATGSPCCATPQTMSEDVLALWDKMFGGAEPPATPPPTVLVGHSMGGGLAVWVAAARRIKPLEGLIIIDIVEGTAMGEARTSARAWGRERPGLGPCMRARWVGGSRCLVIAARRLCCAHLACSALVQVCRHSRLNVVARQHIAAPDPGFV